MRSKARLSNISSSHLGVQLKRTVNFTPPLMTIVTILINAKFPFQSDKLHPRLSMAFSFHTNACYGHFFWRTLRVANEQFTKGFDVVHLELSRRKFYVKQNLDLVKGHKVTPESYVLIIFYNVEHGQDKVYFSTHRSQSIAGCCFVVFPTVLSFSERSTDICKGLPVRSI